MSGKYKNLNYHKEYQKKNRQKLNEYLKQWKLNNPEKNRKHRLNELSKRKRTSEMTKDELLEARRLRRERYHKNPPNYRTEKERQKNRLRRGRLYGAEGIFTSEEWLEIKKKQKYLCLICGSHEKESPLTVDHIIPISKGGKNDISNIQALCRSCNSSKKDKI